MIKPLSALLGALSLCACAATAGRPPVAPTSGVVAKADQVILSGERAFAVAEIAYTVAADGVGRLVRAGVIRGATATRVRALNATARRTLVAGKATADAARKASAAAEIFGIVAQFDQLQDR